MRILFSALFFVLGLGALQGQPNEFIVSGEVLTPILPLPIPDADVRIYSADGNYDKSVKTDREGQFKTSFNLSGTDEIFFTVEVMDPCYDRPLQERISSATNPAFVTLTVCALDDFPCVADFEARVLPNLEVEFYQFNVFNEVNLAWDFGDGATSDEEQPVHRYNAAGSYTVSLIVAQEDGECADTTSREVVVEEIDCDCPDYELPVCVTDSSGAVVTFTNPCEAFCAGYFQFEACNINCDQCPDTLAPVCVRTVFGPITFQSLCEAECAGFTDTIPCEEDCFCIAEFEPVCVTLPDGEVLHFPNACEAECEGYSDYELCDECDCFDLSDAIIACAMDENGAMITFSNGCEAECAGYPEYYLCDTTCLCPFDFDPVCRINPEGDRQFFLNSCFADCRDAATWAPCDTCECTLEYLPVCVLDTTTGDTLHFPNSCRAECAGYTDFVECPDHCLCLTIYDPVCVLTDTGTVTYSNSCYAECAGHFDWFHCDGDDLCGCPEIYEPVCVINDTGDTLTFDNRCFAQCEGYEEEDLFRCLDDGHSCGCDAVFDPVCVVTADGLIQRYASACAAICDGYHVFFDCAIACDCESGVDPVCVELPNGEQLELPNQCWADCLGFGTTVECDEDSQSGAFQYNSGDLSHSKHPRLQRRSLVFPNPFDLGFTISVSEPIHGPVVVFDVMGRMVDQRLLEGSALYIESKDWPAGFYTVVLPDQTNLRVIKH